MWAREIMPITIFEDRVAVEDWVLDEMRVEAEQPGNLGNSKWEGGVIGSFSRNSKLLERSGLHEQIISKVIEVVRTHPEYTRYNGLRYDYEIWWNYYKEGKYQEFHTHNVNVLSGIVYLTDNDSGTVFCERGDRHIVYPKKGKLLIFPSWLGHYVQPCKEERATVAFNFNFHR